MSADNWTTCPRCRKRAEAKKAALVRKAEDSYGSVSAAEYLRLVQRADEPAKLEDTLREDYEIGVSAKGEFGVSYSCNCQTCGFTFRHKYSEDLAKRMEAES